jgi:hypothetical protein
MRKIRSDHNFQMSVLPLRITCKNKNGGIILSGRNYWYVSRFDEIMIDLDAKNNDRLMAALGRLRGLIESDEIEIRSVWLFPSPTKFHFHLILQTPGILLPEQQKTALQLYLFSDVFRTCCNLMRISRKHPNPDLLITPANLWKDFNFYRMHDASCYCDKKHSYEIMEKCKAAILLRGELRAFNQFSKPVSPAGFFQKKFGMIYGKR